MSQQCPPRRGWAGTAAGSWHTHSTVGGREARRVPEEVTLPTYTGLCPPVCPTWPRLGSTGSLMLLSSCLLSVGSRDGDSWPREEAKILFRARHGQCQVAMAASNSGHLSRLPSEVGPAKANEEVKALLIPRRLGLSHQDRCTHTCEVRGEPRGREPARLPKLHLEFLSLSESEAVGRHGQKGTRHDSTPPG